MTERPPADPNASASARLDKWLWAARLFKTRSIAAKACDAGHVKVDDVTAKPSKAVRVGNVVEAVTPGGLRRYEIVKLSEVRGPAEVARTLFLDHSPPPPSPEERTAVRDRGTGRPSKRDLRDIQKLRGY